MDDSFNSLWNRFAVFELPVEPPPSWCDYAVAFAQWADQICHPPVNYDIVWVNQRKVLLLDKYWEWDTWPHETGHIWGVRLGQDQQVLS